MIANVAKERNVNTLTRSEFCATTGISPWQIYQKFDGWREACKLAGIEPNYQKVFISDDKLFEEMLREFLECGKICAKTRFGKLAKFSADTYKKRFGKWEDILFTFRKWIEGRDMEFPYMENLPTDIKEDIIASDLKVKKSSETPVWQSNGGTRYGPRLNFRGLQHEPVNEQGVVFLFGMICNELGFDVEAMRESYHDCDAKRLVDKLKGHMKRVRIEFEFRSKNFKVQGHNPDFCDLIVCWKHDWQECPLEVIELKSIIKALAN